MDLIAIGKIRSTHGVRGFLKVHSFSGETGHFYSLKDIYVDKGPSRLAYIVEQVKPAGKDLFVKVRGIDSPEEGKKLSGCIILARRENAAPVNDGEYYHADLCKCQLVLENRSVGKVISVWNNGTSDYLEIQGIDNKNFMIPFLKQYVGTVDIEKHTIELLEGGLIP